MSLLDNLEQRDATTVDDSRLWPVGPRVAEADSRLENALSQSLAADQREGLQTRALVMVLGGEIVAEAYAVGITPETPLMGWSLGKSLTSLMIGWLQRQGLVAVSENDLFAQWDDDRVKISVENLLHMSSGLDFDEVYAPGSDATRMLFMDAVASGLPLQSALARPACRCLCFYRQSRSGRDDSSVARCGVGAYELECSLLPPQ
jgi:CubicO group peptidase (beta-lactamase class C family)